MTETSVRDIVRGLLPQARADLAELVALPSVHASPEFGEEPNRAAAHWVADAFGGAGIENIEQISTSDGSIAVVGHTPAPAGAKTVLLYSHFDVQPPGPREQWESDPFTLTSRPGPGAGAERWYGRGAADCKGNLVAHLTALRAVREATGGLPVGVRVIVEGSEEGGGEGLDDLIAQRPDLAHADLILIADTGNVAVGRPTLTTSLRGVASVRVELTTGRSDLHSGQFGGAAPDALAALIALLATLRDERGNTTIDGLDTSARWAGEPYDEAAFRADAALVDGTEILGSGLIGDQLWARPAVTVIGLDAPATATAAAAIAPRAAALLNLRVPPGTDPRAAGDLLVAHLKAHTPWGAHVDAEVESTGEPFAADTTGPGYDALRAALTEAYDGAEVVTSGQGGSIPLCTRLRKAAPSAEIALLGVEEPLCRIHAPNESVDPRELERTALAEAILLTSL
ncbi:Peptidase M20 OS=Tsukamurella paurometabola (strain ATCC 8368 / DSM / CCUG 35730 / CIP 100753/ JCM 10117 / KCTC 9821 / NBRC 16120 / NCIMB 702349 / NCTC 13040) OX=521096 GN=Tpau_3706 PE=4 SV=1 [Tsukamurella paurometabola]|uniref:Peptidase M20 n=1 Tax=Tsukamurella paurometabola (strain ATCC 8368 / DSM 20162 / CCUG 35730 / CIP 100753 / JCM 10117 / KCTC 9821 / NBRC 16120 / NCIMB 702349 / NCTC 13040) TaxID=521096 RepID=D5UYI1_TSUPD|nr:dipeptidase [Tsukamurella paurometabola]ADG80284.1 peptidase M20 [Tsukamurella paurometabola DSM 20162]SUP39139.1 Probable succinyl-diaminopimelate desuccinylase [Tsukamurella paurometabola]